MRLTSSQVNYIYQKYYCIDFNFDPYHNSKKALIRLLIEGAFPSPKEWDKIAYQEGYYSHLTLEYISNLNWRSFQSFLKKELQDELKRA